MQLSQSITRKSASNLALAFVLLPKAKRMSMAALYAFCRQVDDLADDESIPVEQRRAQLAAWRADIRAACEQRNPQFLVNQELQPAITAHRLPFEYFDDLIKGVEMDLEINRHQDYQALELYCYRVASVVGLLTIEILEYRDPACRDYAIHLGKALQLTNILRDVRSDAERGRIYIPLSELDRFGVGADEILRFEYSPRFLELAQSVAQRARHYYQLARNTLPDVDRRSMAAAELMASVYWQLLRKLEDSGFNVFNNDLARVSKCKKLFLIFRTWFGLTSGSLVPLYGAR